MDKLSDATKRELYLLTAVLLSPEFEQALQAPDGSPARQYTELALQTLETLVMPHVRTLLFAAPGALGVKEFRVNLQRLMGMLPDISKLGQMLAGGGK